MPNLSRRAALIFEAVFLTILIGTLLGEWWFFARSVIGLLPILAVTIVYFLLRDYNVESD